MQLEGRSRPATTRCRAGSGSVGLQRWRIRNIGPLHSGALARDGSGPGRMQGSHAPVPIVPTLGERPGLLDHSIGRALQFQNRRAATRSPVTLQLGLQHMPRPHRCQTPPPGGRQGGKGKVHESRHAHPSAGDAHRAVALRRERRAALSSRQGVLSLQGGAAPAAATRGSIPAAAGSPDPLDLRRQGPCSRTSRRSRIQLAFLVAQAGGGKPG